MRARISVVSFSILIWAVTACGSSSDTSVVRSDATVVDPTVTDSTVDTVAATPPDTDVPTTETGEPVPSEIAATSWLLDSTITIGGLQPVPGGSGAGITIGADGTMEIDTGCNTGSAGVTFRGEYSMTVGPLTLTEKACTGDAGGIEAAMVFVLAEPMTWSVDGDGLALIPTTVSDTGLHFTASAQR